MNFEALQREDESQLNALAIGHYVMAALTALGGLSILVYLVIGGLVAGVGATSGTEEGAVVAGASIIGILIGLFILAITLGIAFCLFYAGRSLTKQRNYTFCMVVSAIQCLNFPFGTILGVLTIIVLVRDSVRQRFQGA